MTIQEKLRSFDPEEPRIHVFHEGMFAKLYNESAFLFTKHVRRYKVNVTDSKRGRYYSLGFPFSLLGDLLGGGSGWQETEVDPDYRIYDGSAAYDAQEYAAWREQAEREAIETEARRAERAGKAIGKHAAAGSGSTMSGASYAESDRAVSAVPGNGNMCSAVSGSGMGMGSDPSLADAPDSVRAILSDILRFRLESATPLECMFFLQTVQKRCYGALPEFTGIQGRV